jgi:putative membrane protein
LIWAQVSGEFAARAMLLVFVVVVGIYGAASAKRSILFIQALPAAIALALGWANL